MLYHIGRYFALMSRAFRRPENKRLYFRKVLEELDNIGINSLGIVTIVSLFMGAVLTLQVAISFTNPLIPRYLIGLSTRDTMILEFSSTIVCLILSGKVGSNIASEIGTMRITEQIDALEMMGVNSANYLITPKVIAALISFPILNILSIFLGVLGGYFVAYFTDVATVQEYLFGIHYMFIPYYIVYSLIKMMFFAVIITSISAYHGYYTFGGALEVGKSSTRAVVYSIISVLLFNLILTQLLLT